MAGGLVYGARDWAMPPGRRYLVLVWLLGLGLCFPAVAPAVVFMGFAMIAAGLFIAPWLATQYLLIDGLVALTQGYPEGYETIAWVLTGFLSGVAAGAAVSGIVIETAGVRPALVAPVAAVALAAVVAGLRRGSLLALSPGRPST